MYYDLLVKIKNAQMAKKESVQTRFSKFDFAVLKALAGARYIEDVQKKNIGKRTILEIKLKYKNHMPAMTDFRLKSTPSRHLYVAYRDLHPVKQGHGVAILSTPSGVMTNRDARKSKVGGEHLFDVW